MLDLTARDLKPSDLHDDRVLCSSLHVWKTSRGERTALQGSASVVFARLRLAAPIKTQWLVSDQLIDDLTLWMEKI